MPSDNIMFYRMRRSFRGSRTKWFFYLAVCATAVFFGCRGKDREATASVHGVVTLDGEPLPFGQVMFQPLSGRIAKGAIKDGRYTLGTYEAADGAVLGHHRVTVSAREELDHDEPGEPGMQAFGESLIPVYYGNVAKSGLEYTVVAGDNVYNIELTSQP